MTKLCRKRHILQQLGSERDKCPLQTPGSGRIFLLRQGMRPNRAPRPRQAGMILTRRGCLHGSGAPREPVAIRCGMWQEILVPLGGDFLNSPLEVDELFESLRYLEDQLQPYRHELEELGL